ncbi:hypothetical protein CEXT_341651 [Caerostris extrusa]|uniref:Uncharacterized protein n=1 Tax=Caerostris extrusa TaxID=172846 RepID=A0AAV4PGE0_CAEEX|nr:hypothetical protein CEXT_341651 [Caerostris extrusa]
MWRTKWKNLGPMGRRNRAANEEKNCMRNITSDNDENSQRESSPAEKALEMKAKKAKLCPLGLMNRRQLHRIDYWIFSKRSLDHIAEARPK